MIAPTVPRVPQSFAALLAWALAGACAGPEGGRATAIEPVENAYAPPRSKEALDPNWTVDVAFRGVERINGVACGDLVPALPGDEIVSVDAQGVVRLMERRSGHYFENAAIRRAEDAGGDATNGELVQVAVGDLDPNAPGDEVLAVGVARGGEDDGGAGVLRYYSRDARGAWQRRSVLLDALAHAVAIGDLDPDRAGLEFTVAGFFGEALVGYVDSASGAVLLDRVGAAHPGNAKSVALMPRGFVLACDDGNTVYFERDAGGAWARTRIEQLGAPLARIARYGAGGVAVCDNAGRFHLVGADGARSRRVLLERGDRLRGAVAADLDPNAPGLELATAGYDGAVTLVNPDAGTARDVARDTGKLHHLAVGRFDGVGAALVAAGYAGDVLVVAPRYPKGGEQR